MLYGNKKRYPKIRIEGDTHPSDAIGPRLVLAGAAANMLLALQWAGWNGYVRSDDEDEITLYGLSHTVNRMLIEIDTLRDMKVDNSGAVVVKAGAVRS